MTINKILTASFVLGALAFSNVNAEEVKQQNNMKSQEKIVAKKADKEDCANKMFKNIDENNDGFITKKEYKNHLEERFKEMDKNNDGVITEDEFLIKEKTKKNKNGEEKEFKCKEIFKEMDKNGDGKIKEKEYIKFKEKEFEKMDKDGDKKISFEEFKSFKEEKIQNKQRIKQKATKKEKKQMKNAQ